MQYNSVCLSLCSVSRNVESWFSLGQEQRSVAEPGALGLAGKLPKASAEWRACIRGPLLPSTLTLRQQVPLTDCCLKSVTCWHAVHHWSPSYCYGVAKVGGSGRKNPQWLWTLSTWGSWENAVVLAWVSQKAEWRFSVQLFYYKYSPREQEWGTKGNYLVNEGELTGGLKDGLLSWPPQKAT